VDTACDPSDDATVGGESGLATRAKFDEIHDYFRSKSRRFRSFSGGFLQFLRASGGDVGRVDLLILLVSNGVTIQIME